MSWAEVKKINSDLSTPLNELMIERPSGINVNPAYNSDYGANRGSSKEYLQYCESTKTISSSYIEKDNKSIQRYNELWSFANSTNILRKVDLLTGTGTNVLTTNNNISGLILVTKTYVYFWEGNYISRYNKDTGEYKTSTNALTVSLDYVGYICYENDIYAYCLDNNTLDGKGYYKVTDNVDNGGVFTFAKLSTNLPISETATSKFNGCVKSIIELPNNQILVGWYLNSDYKLRLLKIDVTNGSATTVGSVSLESSTSYAYKFTLCPIRDDNDNVLGIIFGLNRKNLSLYNVSGSNLTLLASDMRTYNSTETASTEYDVGYCDNGIFYTLDTSTGLYRVDSSIATTYEGTLVFLPKGTKFFCGKKKVKIMKYKLRENISIVNGTLKYNEPYIYPNNDKIFTCEQNGFYDLDVAFNSNVFFVKGTFF